MRYSKLSITAIYADAMGRRNSRSRQGRGTKAERAIPREMRQAKLPCSGTSYRPSFFSASWPNFAFNQPTKSRLTDRAPFYRNLSATDSYALDFSYARLPAPRTGDAGIEASPPRSFLSIHERSVSRRTSFRRPRDTAGIAAQPCTRPAIALHTCALEQCNNSATSATVSRSKSWSPFIEHFPKT